MQDSSTILAAMLSAIRRDLESTLVPDMPTAHARSAAGMMSELLAYLSIWQRDLREHMPQVATAQQAVINRATALLQRMGGQLPAMTASETRLLESPGGSAEYGRLQQELDQTIEALTRMAGDPSARLSSDAIRDVLAQSVDTELDLLDRELTLVDEERDYLAPPRSAEDLGVTHDALTDFVRSGFPGDPGATIKALEPISDGAGKDSYLFTLRAATGRCRRLVLRRDPAVAVGDNSVVDEFALLKRLFDLGFPVAEPVYCESDPVPLGQPFSLNGYIEGENGTAAWEEDREAKYDICFSLARILGRLHTLTPHQLNGVIAPTAGSPQDHLRQYIARWHDLWLRRRLHASPTLTAAFHWLLENVPHNIDRLALLHGSVGFDKVLVRGGQIQGLLEWEFAHLGDPVEELDHCRQFVEPLVSWTMFLEEYRAAGGGEYSERNARFHAVWRGVRNAVCCSVAWEQFLNGDAPALKMAYQGVPLYHRFVRDTARQLQKELQ
ncbi:MAG: phosphotransferase family protein [Alphaproteobacteria bacterium]